MNEIERLIARLPRPSPSTRLDERIAELEEWPPLTVPVSEFRPSAETTRSGRSLLPRILALGSTAACAGIVGFALGRQSISTEQDVASQPAAPTPAAAVTDPLPHSVVVVHEESEALARFVMPTRFESAFGNGPLIELHQSPLPLE